MKHESQASSCIRVDAGLIIPGREHPIRNGSLISSKDKIVFVGQRESLNPDHKKLVPIKVSVLMPGMWDCHVHFMGADKTSIDDMAMVPPALAGARAAKDIAATLNAGFTSVREMAGYGAVISNAVSEGWLPGPNVYSAVSVLSQTGGHGDAHSLPVGLLCDRIRHGLPFQLCDGVDECIKAVRTQIRQGAKVIKVATSGGVLSLLDDPQIQQFSERELEAIVEEAKRAHRIVAAHTHGKAGILAALRAGCHTIEHGSYMDQEAVDLILQKKALLIPTRSILEYGVQHPEAYSKDIYAKLVKVSEAHEKSYALAVKAGVPIAIGTDLGVSSPTIRFNHGMNGGEFRYAVNAGMTPLQAIEAGTANEPETLGSTLAPKSGQLRAGYDADFIALSANPLENIDILANPDMVPHVWKAGQLYKSPSKVVGLLI